MQLNAEENAALRQLADDLRRDFGATEIRLFGSAAQGDLDAESDVDLFVVVPRLDWPTEEATYDRCYDATLACGRLVSATLFTEHELSDTPLRASPLVLTVSREGVPL